MSNHHPLWETLAAPLETELRQRIALTERILVKLQYLYDVVERLQTEGDLRGRLVEQIREEKRQLFELKRLTVRFRCSWGSPLPLPADAPPGETRGLPPDDEANAAPSAAPASAPAPAPTKPVWTWQPLPLEELEAIRAELAEALENADGSGPHDLTQFKAMIARYQAAFMMRQRYHGAQDAWHGLRHALYDHRGRHYADAFLLPLGTLPLEPAQWAELAERYEALALALPAMDAIEAAVTEANSGRVGGIAAELADCIAAAARRLYLWLADHLPGKHDAQQYELYARLRAWAAEQQQFLPSLKSESDDELARRVAELPARCEEFAVSRARQTVQTKALSQLHALLEDAALGTTDDDLDALHAAVAACEAAGIPATDKRLRDPLLEWIYLLDEEANDYLRRLCAAIAAERARRELREQNGEPDEAPGELPAELQQKLTEIVTVTRGLSALMVGGSPRPESRGLIEQHLELIRLEWPNLDPSDPLDLLFTRLPYARAVFVTRFNRKKSREFIREARHQGKIVIYLPKGYGLHQVIEQAHSQLFRRGG